MPLKIKGNQKVSVRVRLIATENGRARLHVQIETEDRLRDLGEKILDVGDTLDVRYKLDIDRLITVRHH